MSYRNPVALLIAAILGLFGVSSAMATAGGAESIGDTLWSFRAPSSWPCGLAARLHRIPATAGPARA